MRVERVRLAVLASADAMALVALRPHTALFADLRAPHGWIARAGIDGAAAELAAAALWVTAGWLAIGLLAAGIAALPGSCGRTGARIAAVLLPRAIHRLVLGATGLGIVLTPVASHAATPPHPPAEAPAATASPSWPTSAPPPAPMWPTVPNQQPTARHPHRPSPGAQPASAQHVVVAPGDSLWSIAAAHLEHPGPARVSASWPRWYAANRAEIGADPNHIVAGQVLDIPTHHTTHHTTHHEEGPS